MATRSRQGAAKRPVEIQPNPKIKTPLKTTRVSSKSYEDKDETTSSPRSVETKGGKSGTRTKPDKPAPQKETVEPEDDVRRSSRQHSGKSALELLGISPRKARTPKHNDSSSSKTSKPNPKSTATPPTTRVQVSKIQVSKTESSVPAKTTDAIEKAKVASVSSEKSVVDSGPKRVPRQSVEARQEGKSSSNTLVIPSKTTKKASLKDETVPQTKSSVPLTKSSPVTKEAQVQKPSESGKEIVIEPCSSGGQSPILVKKAQNIAEVAAAKNIFRSLYPKATLVGAQRKVIAEKVPQADVVPSKMAPSTSSKLPDKSIIVISPPGATATKQPSEKRSASSVSEDEPSPKLQKTAYVEEVEASNLEVSTVGSEELTVNAAGDVVVIETILPHGYKDSIVEESSQEPMVIEVECPEVRIAEEVEVIDKDTMKDALIQAAQESEYLEEITSTEEISAETAIVETPAETPPEKIIVAQQKPTTPKMTMQRKKGTKKKIVKAIVITPSGEKKEIHLDPGISTVKMLEQILAGSTTGSGDDLAQLAADVNKQIEASMGSESETSKEENVTAIEQKPVQTNTAATTMRKRRKDPKTVSQRKPGEVVVMQSSGERQIVEGSAPDGEIITMVSNVNDDDKIAYEALSQLANGSQGSLELGGSSFVDMEWLQQNGLRVVIASGSDDRWHRQAVGIEDAPALAQLVNNVTSTKVRARPEKHLIASDDLQEMLTHLKPDDNMANHVKHEVVGIQRLIRCKYCNEILNDKHQFRKHMTKHPDIAFKPWKCPICHYRAPVRAQIARHVNIHGELKPYVCKECGKGFNFKQKLLLHLKYHLDIRDKPCPHCDLAFHELKTLKNHIKKIHKIDHVPYRLQVKQNTSATKQSMETKQSSEKDQTLEVIEVTPSNSQIGAESETGAESQDTGDVAQTGDVSETSAEQVLDETTEGVRIDVSESVVNTDKHLVVANGQSPKKVSVLYGTRKTFLYTQQYKMGLLPAADRNNVPSTEIIMDETETVEIQEAMDTPDTQDVEKPRIPSAPKISSANQLEPVLQQFCRIEKFGSAAQFFCKLCEIEPFTSKTGFIHHLEQRHPKIRAWHCNDCNYTSRMRSSLIVHMKLHTGIKDYPCEVCGKAFAFKQKLKNHMKHHLNLREFTCPMCDKAFNEKNDLTKHVKKVHNSERDRMCTVCGKGFKDQVQLRRHMDGHSNTRYLCEHCNKLYRSKVSLAQHMKCHTCMFHCEICDKNFGSYSGFMAHKVMHDESYEGYECELCKKVLHTKGSLTRHLAISHSNERPHACEECGKTFKTKKDLKNHKVVHDTGRKYACDVCEFTCKRPESLRVHMRRHCEVKPFQCGVCGKEYTQKHALETHLRHHTGKVEGTCPICGREFFTRYQLETHIKRKHQVNLVPIADKDAVSAAVAEEEEEVTMEKPVTVFMCEECNSVFMSQDSLAVHILAEHMKQGWLSSADGVVPGTSGDAAAPQSLLHSNLGMHEETLEESPVDNTVEVMTEAESGIVVDTSLQQTKHYDGQATVETLVAICDPGTRKRRLVSLIHPVDSNTEMVHMSGGGDMQGRVAARSGSENVQIETARQKLNALYEQQPAHEAYVAITDPASNQEMLVAMPHSNFESLLAATEAEVQSEGMFISTNGEDYITINTADSDMTTETFVTISSDVMGSADAMVAMSEMGRGQGDSYVAVAETIEIPIETECVTILDGPQ